jgi:hypothetical protein
LIAIAIRRIDSTQLRSTGVRQRLCGTSSLLSRATIQFGTALALIVFHQRYDNKQLPYTFSLSKELPMTATATRQDCVLSTLPTATMHVNLDAPQTSTARQREIAANGAALNQVSRRYQFLMSFLRVMGAPNY